MNKVQRGPHRTSGRNRRKTALVTGAAGQDGVLLCRQLSSAGYRVLGSVIDLSRAAPVRAAYLDEVELHQLDIRDRDGLSALLEGERPDEIYNLAGWSSVGSSFAHPLQVTEVNGLAVLGLLEVVRSLRVTTGYDPRILQASSSEQFGLAEQMPLTESSPHHPRSPYGTAKSFAHHTAVNYRESYGIFIATVILFNHESPLRPKSFVTRKITSAVAAIAAGLQETLPLGRVDVTRDWGSANDYVRAMRMALSHSVPDDYCIATGVPRTLEDFIATAFGAVGISDGMDRVIADPAMIRPADVPVTWGDSSKARRQLGWSPRWSFDQVVESMVSADMKRLITGVEHNSSYLRAPWTVV